MENWPAIVGCFLKIILNAVEDPDGVMEGVIVSL